MSACCARGPPHRLGADISRWGSMELRSVRLSPAPGQCASMRMRFLGNGMQHACVLAAMLPTRLLACLTSAQVLPAAWQAAAAQTAQPTGGTARPAREVRAPPGVLGSSHMVTCCRWLSLAASRVVCLATARASPHCPYARRLLPGPRPGSAFLGPGDSLSTLQPAGLCGCVPSSRPCGGSVALLGVVCVCV